MQLTNLGDGTSTVSFAEALRAGIAPDGSLYFPDNIPQFSESEISKLTSMDNKQIAYEVLNKWLAEEIPTQELRKIVDAASNFDIPLAQVGDKHILELFHGPTMAFKDVAARYMAALMGYFNNNDENLTVLVATSGDTGGAIAHGFSGVDNVRVVILFPKGRVSELQYEQLTRVSPNISSIEVDGSFDDCQSLVKQAFADTTLSKKLGLTSANSISIGRLLPQITYYFQAYAHLKQDNLRFVVPTGNMGNLTGGLLAWRMGLPVHGFVCANNANDVLSDYLHSGEYSPRDSLVTLSNAMDIGKPNNMPRFTKLFGEDAAKASNIVKAVSISDETTIQTMIDVHESQGYLLDPHTAVGWAASVALPDDDASDVIVSTASPVKFSKEILDSTGISISNADELARLRKTPQTVTSIDNSLGEFKEVLSSL